jgi:hypothetical protein
MINVIQLPAEHYLNAIEKNEPFSFSRFGDGEVLCMLRPEFYKNRPQYKDWIFTCGIELKQIFKNKYDYYHCFLDCTFWNRGPHPGDDFEIFLNETCPDFPFYDGEIWQNLSFSGEITKITRTISPYNPVFIGGKHLANMKYVTGMDHNIELIAIDDNNGYLERDQVKDAILKKVEEGHRLFCFSASVLTKALADELYPVIGDSCFLIDFGSVFDPYCGILSRSTMVSVGFEKFQPYTTLRLS